MSPLMFGYLAYLYSPSGFKVADYATSDFASSMVAAVTRSGPASQYYDTDPRTESAASAD